MAVTAPNDGWRIADSAESSATAYTTTTFKAKDTTSNAAGAPELVITYTP